MVNWPIWMSGCEASRIATLPIVGANPCRRSGEGLAKSASLSFATQAAAVVHCLIEFAEQLCFGWEESRIVDGGFAFAEAAYRPRRGK